MNNLAFRWISCAALLAAIYGPASCGSSKADVAPTVIFSASTDSINSGQSVTLNWQATNAKSVTISAAASSSSRTVVNGGQASGSVQDSPTQTTTYTAVANGPGGASAPQSVTVQVTE